MLDTELLPPDLTGENVDIELMAVNWCEDDKGPDVLLQKNEYIISNMRDFFLKQNPRKFITFGCRENER